MEKRKIVLNQLLKDKKLWFASFLIIWAAGLQGQMMWNWRIINDPVVLEKQSRAIPEKVPQREASVAYYSQLIDK
ncbi:hypothetical protein K7X08_001254 [Anisodus acutangulus]|uniref:Uncharacterized protein n=1 Tax=Anisodus acutangulus TaxID=402998 RepID=A0A9Q1MND3_9SOLA|nr:hypothetical protein K7X08_001254 [Anisodus acutangulus]